MKKIIVLFILLFALSACGTGNQSSGNVHGDEKTNGEDSIKMDENYDLKAVLQQLEFKAEAETNKDQVTFKMSLENKNDEPIDISFSSGQQFEIVVKDKTSGNEVYRFSDGKMFTMALITETLQPGDIKTWEDTWDYTHEGKRVEAKEYDVEYQLVLLSVNNRQLEGQSINTTDVMTVPSVDNDSPQTENKGENVSLEDGEFFKNMTLEKVGGRYIIKGETNIPSDVFYYNVEDGHNILVKETEVKVGEGTDWRPFEFTIQIDDKVKPSYGVMMLVLYYKENQSNQGYHEVVLEDLNQ